MNITKIKIKNLFGIQEYESDGKSVELSGKNGVGKTSVIDAIKYALTNKSSRDYIVRNGEAEGEIIIETDTGLSIKRKSRTTQSDYKSVKKNGAEVQSPESFLRDIFAELQLQPLEFMQMDKKDQNRIILEMIEFDWDMNWIKEQFGEIPQDVSYEQNILSVLHDIQAENGYYFRRRQDVNRDIRNKRAFIEEIGSTLPAGYNAEKWESENLGELYKELEKIRKENEMIERAKAVIENKNNKIRKFEADREISLAALETEISTRNSQLEKDIVKLQEQIKALEAEKKNLSSKKADKTELIEQKYKADIAKFEAEVQEYQEYAQKEVADTSELAQKAKQVEDMKAHINEYRRMQDLIFETETLSETSADLTEKIEKARNLPGEILQTAKLPIDDLTIVDGVPLISGLPVSNLSEGEKLDLCIDVALQNPKGLKIILIDGTEKLASDLRKQLYSKCKEKELQFIATRTTDEDTLSIVEL